MSLIWYLTMVIQHCPVGGARLLASSWVRLTLHSPCHPDSEHFLFFLDSGEVIPCTQVVICTGTFLSGEIHIGMRRFPAGRLNDAPSPSEGLSASLAAAGFKLGRLQTGTPARLDGKTINFEGMVAQEGDKVPRPFSFLHSAVPNAVHFFHHGVGT